MRGILSIWRSELWSCFNSLIAYVVILVFQAVSVGLYAVSQFDMGQPLDMRWFFFFAPFIFCFLLPGITMRLWAEERKSGTIELLLTFPMRSWQLVLGKYLAALTFFLLALAGTLVIPILLGFLGDPDGGPIAGGYLGLVFLGAMFLALGMFISAFFKDQLVAFIITAGVFFALLLLGMPFIASRIDGVVRGLGAFLRSYVGISEHLDGFERGVLDLRHLAYFASYAAVFLVLNALTLETFVRLQARLKLAVAGVLLLACAVVFNLLVGDFRGARFDLTEGGIYSVSDASRRILSRLKAPVKVTYYVSARDKMPPRLQDVERDVGDFLRELAEASPHVRFTVTDPTDDAALVKDLEQKGIEAEAGELRADVTGAKVSFVFNSIVISYLDKKDDVLNGIDPAALNRLEYDLVSRILRMTLDETPTVAVAAKKRRPTQEEIMMKQYGVSVPPEDEYRGAAQVLQQNGYDVRRIMLSAREPIPEGVKTLLVFDMNQLDDRQHWEIARFLRGGGSVVVAVQKYRGDLRVSRVGDVLLDIKSLDGNVNDLLGPCGVSIDDDILMDESAYYYGPFHLKLPTQILILGEQMNADLSFANGVEILFMGWGSRLKIEARPGLKSTWLVKTSPRTWSAAGREGSPDDDAFDPSKHAMQGPQTMAALIEGTFPDPFEGKERPAWPPEPPSPDPRGMPEPPPPDDPPAKAVAPKPGKLIVIGCGNLFDERGLQQEAHCTFLTNVVDALTIGEDITRIRAKVKPVRLIPQLTKGKRLAYQIGATGGVPAALILLGVARLVVRRRRRRLPYRA